MELETRKTLATAYDYTVYNIIRRRLFRRRVPVVWSISATRQSPATTRALRAHWLSSERRGEETERNVRFFFLFRIFLANTFSRARLVFSPVAAVTSCPTRVVRWVQIVNPTPREHTYTYVHLPNRIKETAAAALRFSRSRPFKGYRKYDTFTRARYINQKVSDSGKVHFLRSLP